MTGLQRTVATFWVCGLLLASPGVRGLAQSSPLPAIVAIVEDEVITRAELEEATQNLRDELSRRFPAADLDREWQRLLRQEMENMIDEKLILQLVKVEAAKQPGLPYINEKQIDEYVQQRLGAMGMPQAESEVLYEFVKRNYGWDRKTARERFRRKMSIDKYMWKNVFSGIRTFISPKEATYYYRDHRADFSTPVEVVFRMITIKANRYDFDFAVREVERGLKAGEDFVRLAKQFSETSRRSEPTRWKKSFDELEAWQPQIREALRKMKAGQISPRVPSKIGYHYLQVETIVDGVPKDFGDKAVQKAIKTKILGQRRAQAQMRFLKDLRARNHVQVFLPPTVAPELPPSPLADPTEVGAGK